jgi:hypothetical protein
MNFSASQSQVQITFVKKIFFLFYLVKKISTFKICFGEEPLFGFFREKGVLKLEVGFSMVEL